MLFSMMAERVDWKIIGDLMERDPTFWYRVRMVPGAFGGRFGSCVREVV